MGKIGEVQQPSAATDKDPTITARATSPKGETERETQGKSSFERDTAVETARTASKEKIERNESVRNKSPIVDEKEQESPRKCRKPKSCDKVSAPTIGFPAKLPPRFLNELTIEASFEAPEARSGLVVSQAMLVLQVEEYSVFSGKVAICDFIFGINDHEITSKSEFCELIRSLKRSAKPFTMKVKRPVWNLKTDRLPKGYDVVPGYDYFQGLMVLYPGGKLGMNVKSYNSKVYVTHTDQLSLSTSTCIVGDCIVEVSGTPVTCTAVCSSIILKTLKEKKYVIMTLERAVTQRALHFVRFVLLAEKTKQLDPRMAADTTRIGCSQALRIQNILVPAPSKSIYRSKNHKTQNKRITIRNMALLTLIETDPFNPLLMQAVPPKKMDSFIEKVRHSRESILPTAKEVLSSEPVDRRRESARRSIGYLFNWK
ncbi:hypothetical protein Tcan_18644 [Toxocara canis]|uniref:PDZ domain-containing protein n=1 Tax=Toxocara canis TaxID=6265 RepID=A0A0B2UY56_TOXCA|nr:hypothetical protein Tcan_18644 [Toxocara canis]